MDIRAYKVKELPYHFMLFYNIDEKQLAMIKMSFHGEQTDNAVLTYCYLDSQCGLSYKVICCACIADGRVTFTPTEKVEIGYTIREGGIVGEAIIIDEGDLEQFKEEADFIKECYGYDPKALSVEDDDPFSTFRHPSYPNDILALFFAPEGRSEEMWVTELEKGEAGAIKAKLLNEPYNEHIGVHEGDFVAILPLGLAEDYVAPVAILGWMKDLGIDENGRGKADYDASEIAKKLRNWIEQ